MSVSLKKKKKTGPNAHSYRSVRVCYRSAVEASCQRSASLQTTLTLVPPFGGFNVCTKGKGQVIYYTLKLEYKENDPSPLLSMLHNAIMNQ